MASAAHQAHMRQAIAEMRRAGVVERTGGPFGAVVVRDHDPTAHAEVNASGECCPMCWAAASWARISKVYFASRWSDCADLFDDAHIAADMARPTAERQLAPEPLLREEALAVWEEFRGLADGARY
jgi:tRNA(Arg) A34 adenosine deaminase TadA